MIDRSTRLQNYQHFELSVAIGRTRGGKAIRARHVGRITLLQPRRTSHQQTGADAQRNEHENLSETHLTSLTAKVAQTTVSLGETIRKRRLEGTLRETNDLGLDVQLNAETVGTGVFE